MAIPLSSQFSLNAGLPIEVSLVVADLTARDAIAGVKRFQGMFTYVVSLATTYQLQGGVTNSDWVAVYGGVAATGVVSISYSGLAALIAGNTVVSGQTYFIYDRGGFLAGAALAGSGGGGTTPSRAGLYMTGTGVNTISVNGIGGFYNADFQSIGDYSGVPSYAQTLGIFDEQTTYNIGDVVISYYPPGGSGNGMWVSLQNGNVGNQIPSGSNAFWQSLNDLSTDPTTKGFILEYDVIEYDFANDYITSRTDKRGNKVQSDFVTYTFIGASSNFISLFQFGNNSVYGNTIYGIGVLNLNRGTVSGNTLYGGQTSLNLSNSAATITENVFEGQSFISISHATSANTVFGSLYLISRCSFNGLSIFTASMTDNTKQCYMYSCVFESQSNLDASDMEGQFLACNFRNGVYITAQFNSLQTFENCEFSGNSSTLAPVIITLDPDSSYTNKRYASGFSNFDTVLDVTGLVEIDMAGLEYCGNVTLFTTNGTETVAKVVNNIRNHPIEFTCENGSTITFTASPIAGPPGVDEIVLEADTDVTIVGRSTVSDFLTLRREVSDINRQVTGSVI